MKAHGFDTVRSLAGNLRDCVALIGLNIGIEAKWNPIRVVNCILLLTILYLLS